MKSTTAARHSSKARRPLTHSSPLHRQQSASITYPSRIANEAHVRGDEGLAFVGNGSSIFKILRTTHARSDQRSTTAHCTPTH
jgi:hypothetical protein